MKYVSTFVFYLIIAVSIFFEFSSCKIRKDTDNDKNNYNTYYQHLIDIESDTINKNGKKPVFPRYMLDLDFLNGYSIPSFSAKDLDGKVCKIDYRNKITLLNFWFIGCQPCVEEIPFLNKLQAENLKDLQVISLCRDDKDDLNEFILKTPIGYKQIPNASKLIDSTFKFKWGYPKNILINKDGKVLMMTRGIINTKDSNYIYIIKMFNKYK